MKKLPLKPLAAAEKILTALPSGILMTTKANGITDTMVIGWGTMGIDWGIPIFTAFVRESRYTKELVDANPYFTINVPVDNSIDLKEIVRVCGTMSGRDVDKFALCHLDLVESANFSVPAIAQLPLTLECEVIYTQEQDKEQIEKSPMAKYYPQKDFHTAYTARIVSAYILKAE